MKKEWADIFQKKTNKIKIENRPYKCTICNVDTERFKASHTYAHHMKARHINHKGFDISLPPPSTRQGMGYFHILPGDLIRGMSIWRGIETILHISTNIVKRR